MKMFIPLVFTILLAAALATPYPYTTYKYLYPSYYHTSPSVVRSKLPLVYPLVKSVASEYYPYYSYYGSSYYPYYFDGADKKTE